MKPEGEKFRWHEFLLTDPKLSQRAKVVAGWLMHRFNSTTGAVEIAITTLAQDLDMSPSTVKRAVRDLLNREWIEVQVGPHGANFYFPLFNRVEAAAGRISMFRAQRARQRLENPKWRQRKSGPTEGSAGTQSKGQI